MTKALLLPMDRASASEQSLAIHLALVACRSGHGNGHLINELMRAVYLSWFLQCAGFGSCPVEQFRIAEYAVEATLARAHECGEWHLPGEAIEDFEALVALYDSQLASVPLHEVLAAERKLRAFLAGNGSSPISMNA
ncbi:hypothetical protein [Paraburkholderia sp. BL6665CI2N2]|uniref:hypothetical protein n=1 Tax=Paraburkholderia sp. BL6665CI2N2 TaxID=1938806 RepID=UPI001FBAA45C|nr:hypothetical protein [Paraburkholderia sp. BL6665CI2N2]